MLARNAGVVRGHREFRFRLAAIMWLSMLAGLPMAAQAAYGKPAFVIPANSDTIVEKLPRGYAALMPSAEKPAASLQQVQQLLATAAATGDARLAARADQLLAKFPESNAAPDVLRARAFSAQHRHDFKKSLLILDQLVAALPRDGDARLSRAQVHLVQGRLDLARADCASLAMSIDASRGMACLAALSMRQGNLVAAAGMADRWLDQAPANDPSRRYMMVMRAEIAARTGNQDAREAFNRALALAPGDVRTLASYARYLRASGQQASTLPLLAGAPASDSLQLERTLAAAAIGDPSATALAQQQARRYALAHQLGSEPELREEAEFMLTIAKDPGAALKLAQRNFEQQRDEEDVDIMRRAARAANRPEAMAPVRAWAKGQGLPELAVAP